MVREGGWGGEGEISGEEQDSGREGFSSIGRRRVPYVADRLWVRVRNGRADTLSNLGQTKLLIPWV